MLADTAKEEAVVAFVGIHGTAILDRQINPDDFFSPIYGTAYAAALTLAKRDRSRSVADIVEHIEQTRHLLRIVESVGAREGMPDWRDVIYGADSAMAYNRDCHPEISRFLADIAELSNKRRAVEIGKNLAGGEIDARDAAGQLLEISGSSSGLEAAEIHTFRELAHMDVKNDPTTLLGQRWVCQGGQLLIVGQSGVGKSSLTMQAAMTWAIGQPFFGIAPKRPLRTLYVQAENDKGDTAEVAQGVLGYVGKKYNTDKAAIDVITNNLILCRLTSQTGEAFVDAVGELIRQRGPFDLVMADPLLSYIGDDISQQSVASHFLRNLCNPLAFRHKFAWVFSHHTGKPQSDSKARSHWNSNDFAYIGLGSSELTNWARAICVLQTTKEDGVFRLLLAKRGNRAGVVDVLGDPCTEIYIKHGDGHIFWEPCEPPAEEPETEKKSAGRPPALSELQVIELRTMWAMWQGANKKFYAIAAKKFSVSADTIKRKLHELESEKSNEK